MRVYTTKYALTAGIEIHEVEPGSTDPKYVYLEGRFLAQQFVMDKNAFLTYEEAAIAACEMRDRKIKSVKKQLARLTSLLFPTAMPENFKE